MLYFLLLVKNLTKVENGNIIYNP